MWHNRTRSFVFAFVLLIAVVPITPRIELSADEVTFIRSEVERTLAGEIVAVALNEEMLFRSNDGRLWTIHPDELVESTDDDTIVPAMTKDEIGEQLLAELPDDFFIYETDHFVVAYQTNKAYARWVGGLNEKLFRNFEKFWEKNDFELTDPDFPLAVIIFGDKAGYTQYLQRELGPNGGDMVAYYNLLSNRVAMYDLTADMVAPGQAARNNRRVNEILSVPAAVPMVATIIHESTHQLIFNRGMQTRFSDTPLWLNEGLAMYFETPDPNSERGWNKIGAVNMLRYPGFMESIAARRADSLEMLISGESLFHDPETALDAYAHSWALNYFLLEKHPEEFTAYIQHMSEKQPLDYDIETVAEVRLGDFRQFFGDDLNVLDREFIAYMRSLN